MDLTDFILEHENDDIAALVLHRDRWPDVDVALAAECIASRRKIRLKVPEWYADPGLICPVALSAEQCSSTATATYKAAVAQEACRLGRIADLTGGLGIDCWQFSKVAGAVLYNEMNPVLFEAAKANLKCLGCDNVEFSNTCISPETLPGLLDSFKPDLVFADPARRSEGRKVFMPEDCSPDVLALQDIVLGRGCCFMIKLSPMADISLMLRKFHCVRELHVVETDGECKELLLMLEAGFGGDAEIVVACPASGPVSGYDDSFRFFRAEEKAAVPLFISEAPVPGQILFEPGPALSKSSAFNLLGARFGLRKLGPSAHLYCTYPSDSVRHLGGYGKCFEIQEVAPFGKASLRDFATRWPGAGVTARALPLSSDELRLKLSSLSKKVPRGGMRCSGTDLHLFGVGTSIGLLLISARRT